MEARTEILQAAERYHDEFVPNGFTAAPTRHLVVLTCMDARLDLFRSLGLNIGDAHILRNAGGRATEDAIRSLTLSTHWLGTREIAVIHHTGCGLHGLTNDEIAQRVEAATGTTPDIDFRPFSDLHQSVADDVERISACPLLPTDATVWGAIYDVASGRLTPVGETRGITRPSS
jgi:carbonic anhydrase